MKKAHVLYGPPGTGKTTELMARATECAKTIKKHRIGFVSFTKAAATELAERLGVRPGGNISTVHSMAFRLANISRDQVVNYGKLKEFERESGIEMTGGNPEEAEYVTEGDNYLALHSLGKARLDKSIEETFSNSDVDGTLHGFKYFCEYYEKFKKANGYVDFSDMLDMALNYDGPQVDVLFVDEAQDLSPQQWRLIEHWGIDIPTVHIAGDDDQAIYKWGGADPQGMINFQNLHDAEKKILSQSYRIPSAVHEIAQDMIERITDRVEKSYAPREELGSVQFYADPSMLKFTHGEDCMILYRNHYIRKDIEEVLIARNVPFTIIGGRPGPLEMPTANCARIWKNLQKEIKEFCTYSVSAKQLKMLAKFSNPRFTGLIERGKLEDILEEHWSIILRIPWEVKNFLKVIDEKWGLDVKPTIRLSTIHGSKGREADRVIVINGMSDKTMLGYTKDPDSEIRTFYVGITRARHKLHILMDSNPLPNLRKI
ncbi:MAG: ATP-dependent helicase [Gammaproteobacteria bacterium]|nr:ATP-dependent helicase [Gammaproteobacteria bacterium]